MISAYAIHGRCPRALWWESKQLYISDKKKRLARLSQSTVQVYLEELQAQGYTVHTTHPKLQKKYEYLVSNGHVLCHADGIFKKNGQKEWALIKVEMTQEAQLLHLLGSGMKRAMPALWAGAQLTMGACGIQEFYLHVLSWETGTVYQEKIPYEASFYQETLTRLDQLLTAIAPVGLGQHPEDPACISCEYKQNCYADSIPEPHCRNCVFRDQRYCTYWAQGIDVEDELSTCTEHIYDRGIIHFAKEVQHELSGRPTWILYERGDFVFKNVGHSYPSEPMTYTSKELYLVQKKGSTDQFIQTLKEEFPGIRIVTPLQEIKHGNPPI